METYLTIYIAVGLVAWAVNSGIMFHWAQNLWLSDPRIADIALTRRRQHRIESITLGGLTMVLWPIFTPFVYFLFNRARAGIFRQRIVDVRKLY